MSSVSIVVSQGPYQCPDSETETHNKQVNASSKQASKLYVI